MKKLRFWRLLGMKMVFLALVGLAETAFAQKTTAPEKRTPTEIKGTPTKTIKIEDVVVTATKIQEPKKDIPASVQVITQEDIKNSTAEDVGDLIAEAGIGHVHKYPGALTARIGVRGLTTDLFSASKSKVLVLINGHRAGTVNLAKIPVEDIERIEIVKGPASVLYGSCAMGGVINIITKEGKEGMHCSISGEIGSWGHWKPRVELNGKKGRFDFYLVVSRSSQDNYRATGYGKIDNTAYNDHVVSGRLGYKFPFYNHHISFGFQHWKGWNIGSPGPRFSPDPDDYSNRERTNFDLRYKTGTIDLGYYFVKDKDEWHEGPTADPWGTPHSITLRKTDTQGINLQKTFSIGDHRIIIGKQWDRIGVKSSRNIGTPYHPNSRYDSYGVFSEGRLGLFNKRVLVSAGLRYDYFKNEILPTRGIINLKLKKKELKHTTARGGLVYKLTDNLNLKGNVGTGFRAPAPDELAADYVGRWGRFIGNPNLRPEKSTSYDGGIEYAKDFFKGGLAFFHTDFKDKILVYHDKILAARTFKNVDGATIQGIETNVSYDAGLASGLNISIEPFTNITYHTKYTSKDEFEIRKYGKTLHYISKWIGVFGIRLGHDKWEARIIANYTGPEKVIDWNRFSPTFGKTIDKGDFTVMNLKGSYRPIKNLEITASIENLLNSKYGYVLNYPMPGRTFMGSARWLF